MKWTCQNCKKEFERSAFHKNCTPKYCSNNCYHQSKVDSGHFYVCPTCGKRFKSHSVIIPIRFCSKACRDRSLIKTKPVFKCQNCNRDFTIKFSGITRKAKFCSRNCWRQWGDGIAKKHTCEQCGQLFKSGNSDPRFCSRQCYWLHRGPSRLEKSIWKILDNMGIKFEPQFVVNGFVYDLMIIGKTRSALIECDGYYWHSTKEAKHRDAIKEKVARINGYFMLRFPEHEINNNLESVRHKLLMCLD